MPSDLFDQFMTFPVLCPLTVGTGWWMRVRCLVARHAISGKESKKGWSGRALHLRAWLHHCYQYSTPLFAVAAHTQTHTPTESVDRARTRARVFTGTRCNERSGASVRILTEQIRCQTIHNQPPMITHLLSESLTFSHDALRCSSSKQTVPAPLALCLCSDRLCLEQHRLGNQELILIPNEFYLKKKLLDWVAWLLALLTVLACLYFSNARDYPKNEH